MNKPLNHFTRLNELSTLRDMSLIAWVCTYSPDWKDKEVTDLTVYRSYLLESAKGYEQERAELSETTPTPIIALAEQMMSAMKRCPRAYTYGIAVAL